jgi:UDP-glucose 4-epimerase
MSILITGGAGYIGSVTTELLRARGESVVVLDNLSRGFRDAVAPEIPFYGGDVGNRELVTRIVRDHSIDACVHFAAFAYVGESVNQPALYYENNVAQGIHLLGALIEAGVRRFVFSSTCATYGEPQRIPISEDHPQLPTNPYGWTKLFLERIMTDYDRSYGLRFVALRYFNAAGATAERGERHEPETHLIPLVLQVAAGTRPTVTIFGDDYPTRDRTCVRDYIHVRDLAQAHVLAIEALRPGDPLRVYNLGCGGDGYTIREVIDVAERVTGRRVPVTVGARRPGDPAVLIASSDLIVRDLGWRPAHQDLATIVDSAWQFMQRLR